MTTLTADGYTTGTVNARGVKLTIKSKPADKTNKNPQVVTKFMLNGRNLMTIVYRRNGYWLKDNTGKFIVARRTLKDATALARNFVLRSIDNAIEKGIL